MLVTSLKLVKCKTMKRAREPLLTIRSVSFAHGYSLTERQACCKTCTLQKRDERSKSVTFAAARSAPAVHDPYPRGAG